MTVFAKCHHGFSYYPTEVGTRHPNLAVPDLMGARIEALHGIGAQALIYVSIMWDDLAGEKEPGWVIAQGRKPHDPSSSLKRVALDRGMDDARRLYRIW